MSENPRKSSRTGKSKVSFLWKELGYKQLKEFRSKLVEADAQKASAYKVASLFRFLIEGLDPFICQTPKNVLDLQPNLTRKQRSNSFQNYL